MPSWIDQSSDPHDSHLAMRALLRIEAKRRSWSVIWLIFPQFVPPVKGYLPVYFTCNPPADTYNPYGYPDCCVEAFHEYSERYQRGEADERPGIHCYVPCDACLERAPLEELWQEIVDRRGYGCVNALDHLVTHVEGDVSWTTFCDECAA